MAKYDLVIVGGGIAGLCAAIHLQNEGLNIKILEATDRVGGRVKTDMVEGFLLDRGFQVLLTSYPEALRMLDYNSLGLKNFIPGAIVHYKNKNINLLDPIRKPIGALPALFSNLGNIADKLKVAALRNRVKRLSIDEIFEQPESSTINYLREWNFSTDFINGFFRPFLGGIFLEPALSTSNRMFQFVFKMFSQGFASLPSEGIEAISRQLAEQLKRSSIEVNAEVVKIDGEELTLANGEKIKARAFMLATTADVANKLIGKDSYDTTYNTTKCMYFATDKPPIIRPILGLNGDKEGLVNNICVPSVVNPNYAPPGRHLISVSIIKPSDHLSKEDLVIAVKTEMRKWFKKEVRYWEHLKTYTIKQALPAKPSISIPNRNKIKAVKDNIWVCGDHIAYPSLNGAMESARYTANAVSWHLALNK